MLIMTFDCLKSLMIHLFRVNCAIVKCHFKVKLHEINWTLFYEHSGNLNLKKTMNFVTNYLIYNQNLSKIWGILLRQWAKKIIMIKLPNIGKPRL